MKVHLPGFKAKGFHLPEIQGSVPPTPGIAGKKLEGVTPQGPGPIQSPGQTPDNGTMKTETQGSVGVDLTVGPG